MVTGTVLYAIFAFCGIMIPPKIKKNGQGIEIEHYVL